MRTSDVPAERCPWHRIIALDARNGLRAGPNCPSEHVVERTYAVLPSTYSAWQAEHGSAPPAKYSPLCPANGAVADAVTITYPRANETFLIEPGYARTTQSVKLMAEVDPPVDELTWIVDGNSIASVGFPYETHWTLDAGAHRIEARAGKKKSEAVLIHVE
jgi:penicillin-binding protein 1C